jgi:methanogenic corrinoid protein MtbC1
MKREVAMTETVADYEQAIVALKRALVSNDRLAARAALPADRDSTRRFELLERIVVPTLESIGEDWERGQLALSQVYLSGRICEELVDSLLPPGGTSHRHQPPMAIATLADHHLLGKRIVLSVLKAGGYQVHDYGRMEAAELAARVLQDDIGVLFVSTLMLPSALRVSQLRSLLDEQQVEVRIVVGGAPFRLDQELWQEVRADAMCRTASEVIGVTGALLGGAS